MAKFESFKWILELRSPLKAMVSGSGSGAIKCWIPQLYNYNGGDQERRAPLKWSALYKRISLMENPEAGSPSVLDEWEKDGRNVNRWELSRIVKELRKYRRYKLALGVFEWMDTKGDRFKLSASDAAIQLDLIAKVRGIPSAEEYFSRLSRSLTDKRTYTALLSAYVGAKMKDKAEALMEEMKTKGYDMHSLPLNLMMTLYMKLEKYDKVLSLIAEMIEKNIAFDIYSYNIWLTTCGTMGSIEKMEAALEQMKQDKTVNPNWTTYSTMATMYMNLGQRQKAKQSLQMVESKMTGRDRIPYHYLLSLYGSVSEKKEVYRIWDTYKSGFSTIPNLGYHAMIASLIRLDDIEGAEQIYEEWLSARTTFDPRVCNLLVKWYARNGRLEKAKALVDDIFEVRGKANSYTWEFLAEGYIKEKQITEALSCLKKATLAEGAKNWRPSPRNASMLFLFCEQKSDTASKEALMELLRQLGCLENEPYMSQVKAFGLDDLGLNSVDKDGIETDRNGDGTHVLLNQLEPSL
ncbi:hypothetical protein Scep_026572 [Stephania cephalantha]|uniref:Pentatricopeptide repeat-containing protein n=1 Tax=Stephania cephalantha TaxID=152367 RepID=A0AAP0ER15_9MAGN